MNATTESLLLFLPLVSRYLAFSLTLFHHAAVSVPRALSPSLFPLLTLGLVSVVSATSFAPHINARFIPQNPGRYRIYIFVASL